MSVNSWQIYIYIYECHLPECRGFSHYPIQGEKLYLHFSDKFHKNLTFKTSTLGMYDTVTKVSLN